MTKTCQMCGKDYDAGSHSYNQKYCKICRVELNRQRWKYESRKRRKAKKEKLEGAFLKPKSMPSKTINEIIREMMAYNKKHGTHLTYGKYVEKMTLGLLKD